MTDWDSTFANAHLTSGPATDGLTVSKSVPTGARDIYREDKEKIHSAAKKHGYTVLFDNAKVISFIKAK
jgi:hypothetical protein